MKLGVVPVSFRTTPFLQSQIIESNVPLPGLVKFWKVTTVGGHPAFGHGQEYSLQEVRMMKQDLHNLFKVSNSQKPKEWQNILAAVDSSFQKSTSNPIRQIINTHIQDWRTLQTVKSSLKHLDISAQEQNQVLLLVKQEIQLNHKIGQLQTMQQLFRYWHVAHLPFALIMLVIMVIHIIITLMFGYNWMF